MSALQNRLGEATSPYLLQHRDNPVEWQPWDETALAAARATDKPILLSIGYAACHWCHVMAHESFENAAVAAQMNAHFVNIKVDREERPDLDQIYQHALGLLGQQGGWPLTMFLTPAGEPFWGGTYFPPESRYGRPGLPEVLETVSRIWSAERDKVVSNTTALKEALAALGRPAPGPALTPAAREQTARRLVQAFDTIHGGLGGAPKFPQVPVLDLVWRHALATGDAAAPHAVLHTLTNICQGGIYDHLGGGFARYAVDAFWLVPHFEKMLYDNAQLLLLLAEAFAESGNPLFRVRAVETVGWLEREMQVGDAFASSLDADSEGEEGRYYVWEAAEVDRLLGGDADRFRLTYGITDGGNWEGRTVLNRLHQPGLLPPEEEAAIRASADVLLAARAERVAPGRDDKVLADWNGLMITALARASTVFDRPEWLEHGRRAFKFILDNMMTGDRLSHSWRGGRRLELAFLDDYADMAAAALALFEAAADSAYLRHAERWIALLEAEYLDAEAGGYFQVPGSASVLVRAKNAQDGPTPAANGVLLGVVARLHLLTGERRYLDRALQLRAAFAGEVARNPAAHAALLSATLWLDEPVQILIIGPLDDPACTALRRIALAAALPAAVVLHLPAGQPLPEGHPAAGKNQVEGRPTVYVCPGQTCRLPVTDPATLAAALAPQGFRHRG